MKLPLPSFGKKDKSEYYLSLLLRDEKACAVVLEEQNGKLQVISQHEEPFTTSIEDASAEELLDVLDKTISRAEETLPKDTEMEKTVFGVKDEWVEEKKIKKEYLAKLKKVCDELGLSPIGFLVITEAIAHLIQEEEGAPTSAILIEVGKKAVRISLLRAGRIIASKVSRIMDSIPETVDTALKHFEEVEVLPSRIIIFDGGGEEQLAQAFIKHNWSKSLPFLHVPQISILPPGFDAKSIVFGAAVQMGFDILGPLGNIATSEIKTIESTNEKEPGKKELEKEKGETDEKLEKESMEKSGEDDSEIQEEGKTTSEEAEVTSETLAGDNFGFVTGMDIASKKEEEDQDEKKQPNDLYNTEDQKGEEPKLKIHHYTEEHAKIGNPDETFAVANEEELKARPQHSKLRDDTIEDMPIDQAERHGKKPFFLISLMSGIPNPLKHLPGSLPTRFGGKLFIPLVLLVILFAALAYLYMFKLGATVTLSIKPKDADQAEKITLSSSGESDFSSDTIAAKKVSTSVDGSVTATATGKKQVGTKAKGTVTIYNSDSAKKQLSAGTIITSSNKMDFTLDKDTSVASASGDIFSGTKPGTTQATVTAKDIGQEYNMPSNTKFTVGSSSSLAGKNDSAFSGGTKKEVTVVSKKDVDGLEDKLIKSLTDKAKSNLQEDADEGDTIVPFFLKTTLSNPSFDKDVDDEAKQVTLKAKVVFDTLAYQSKDLKDFAQSLLKEKYDQDVTISEDSISNTLSNLKKKDDSDVSADLLIKADLLPRLDTETIKNDIKGKSFDDASSKLNDLPQVSGVTIVLSPNIPFLPKILPRMANNITIDLHTE